MGTYESSGWIRVKWMDTSQVCVLSREGGQVGANESNGDKLFQLVQNIVFIKFSEVCNSDCKIFFFAIFKNFFL